jgi:ferredoxin-thioredoxin reductase catalytic subunit|tara:strand:- start:158 stop:451 length:294 start_codon:yes stop_codon:yes gene_type:complete
MEKNNVFGVELDSSTPETLKKAIEEYSKKAGITSNKGHIDVVIKGLLAKKKKFGEIYCPCRVVTGNKEKDKEIICPCVFHRGEIGLQGHCLCNLFVK